ncbi:glycosyltransferase family 4 protein [Rossellomorea vietnamensis]|uniref:glycosyltransferase family 4 protein n=1 Tax=Rossellomorea vietnamensis TaxID=218284 RepID=UPI001CCAFE3E|nr:glycosyltransferase family 4 protein [Rossellomorea vietnamensis]MCA0148382.1 glycosyltransferase family 4 protein [Rossellomorea vietnamensis]
MRILLVSYYPLPYPGGLWKVVSNLQSKLIALGHSVDIFAQFPDLSGYRLMGHGAMTTMKQQQVDITKRIKQSYPECISHAGVYSAESYRLNFDFTLKQLDLKRYDVIHAQDVTAARTIGEWIIPHPPLITSAHGSLTKEIFFTFKDIYPTWTDRKILEGFDYYYYKYNETHGYKSSRYIHTQSNWMKREIINNFSVPVDKVISFPLGIKNTQFNSPVRRRNQKKIILFSGRLVYLKGVTFLLEALKILRESRTDWECWIVGEGTMENKLKELSDLYGLSNYVAFKGLKSSMEATLAKADILVMPSLQDTQPLSVVEAQFAGVPVIVSDAGGLPEMVQQGHNGYIVPAGNSKALSIRIRELLDNEHLRVQMGSRSRQWAEQKWSLDSMTTNMLELYESTMV